MIHRSMGIRFDSAEAESFPATPEQARRSGPETERFRGRGRAFGVGPPGLEPGRPDFV